jgi:hypothetical protein
MQAQNSVGSSMETPEVKELTKKQVKLSALADRLSQSELELATIKADLRTFQAKYLRIVGVKYAELDEIEAQIAEIQARHYPVDKDAQEKASEARDQARESAHATESIQEEKQQNHFEPSEDLKRLYREAAKAVHPDLATDEKARIARQAMMVDVNLAYEKNDPERLRSILRQWGNSPQSVEGEGTGAELIRTIRKIALVEERLGAIDRETTELKATDLWRLKEKIENAEKEGRDMLAEMVISIESRIGGAKNRLNNLINEVKQYG